MAPIPAEVFDRTVTKPQAGADITVKLGEAKDTGFLDSQHRQVEVERDYTPAQCLFCNVDSPTTDNNFEHMLKVHGMFIPNQEGLEDAEGFLSYLFHIISDFHECLYCGKIKQTVEGIRSHMLDKGHCRIAFDEELDQFYDFESGSDDGADEAEIGEDEDFAEADKPSPAHEHEFQPDGDHELHLPSGRILGHRSLSRYYRQNLHSYPTPAERAASRAIAAAGAADGDSSAAIPPGRQLATGARSEMGMIGVSELEKRALRLTEKKALKQEARAKNLYEWRVHKESNHQKHYRVSGLGVPLL